MMKLLNGKELSGYITERQARQVRALRQAENIFPTLAIVTTSDDPVIAKYVSLKQRYGADILVDVIVHRIEQSQLLSTIRALNDNQSVHGIIVQLPLADPTLTDQAVNAVDPSKDVDGLGENAVYTPATATAIDWLLAGYNIELRDKAIALIGHGRLVGRPLEKLWVSAGYNVSVYDDTTTDLAAHVRKAQVIVSATGHAGLVTSDMLQPGAIVVDAGTSSENGKLVGDIASDVRERQDLTITPRLGGVGPLTVTALFDNVIQAARATVTSN